ncbi:hypothetical protein T484DRAFT_1887696, partial [Baffinella frigidus]
ENPEESPNVAFHFPFPPCFRALRQPHRAPHRPGGVPAAAVHVIDGRHQDSPEPQGRVRGRVHGPRSLPEPQGRVRGRVHGPRSLPGSNESL